MGIFSRKKKTSINITTKHEGFSGWIKCSGCSGLIHVEQLSKNINCCPECGYHYRLATDERVATLTDKDTFNELFNNIKPTDPLNFVDSKPYSDRIEGYRKKCNKFDALTTGTCKINDITVALAILDFSFIGGSMGSVVGEKLTRLVEHAIAKTLPVIAVIASGGARMQESIYSLMQMAKTTAAFKKLDKAGLLYIPILTNPSTGGVLASFATVGDIIIAEPCAVIGFTGPKVLAQTTGMDKLPEDAQSSEFLLKKGLIDKIVARKDLKKVLGLLLALLAKKPKSNKRLILNQLQN